MGCLGGIGAEQDVAAQGRRCARHGATNFGGVDASRIAHVLDALLADRGRVQTQTYDASAEQHEGDNGAKASNQLIADGELHFRKYSLSRIYQTLKSVPSSLR